MSQRIIFRDLAGLADRDRLLTADDDRWLTSIAEKVDANAHAIRVARSCAAEAPEPILQRQLDGGWKAGRYVGELRQGDRVLEIQPRLGIDTVASWAGTALNVRVTPSTAAHAGTHTLIAELTAAIWRGVVIEASRHGLPGLRATRSHVGPAIRGRLDLEATLALRAKRTPMLASIERPKIVDNPIARALVLADRALDRRLGFRPDWRGDRIAEMMPRLRAATGSRPRLPSRTELDRVRYTPITLPYRRAAELSWQIAHNRGPLTDASGESVEGVLIDVAELWELFLLSCLRQARKEPVTHGTYVADAVPLLRSVKDPSRILGRLYPDLLVGDPHTPRLLIDAKYKPLRDPRSVDREDLYQLTSYLLAHDSAAQPAGMLAYPQFDDRPAAYAEAHGPWTSPAGHNVSFRRLPITETACVQAFRNM
jgi:5-methylcytosine-specific restriction enzyme subunit McrC